MVDTPLIGFAFPATGGSFPRTMPDRLADTINVRDRGAVGNGAANDRPAIQACIDAAFGSAGSPHGSANSKLNKPLYFPPGQYNLDAPLVFTDLVGATIYGSGRRTSWIRALGSSAITVNGCENTTFSSFNVGCDVNSPSSGRHCFSFSVGAGSVGLQDVLLDQIDAGLSQYGVRIAPGGGAGGKGFTILQGTIQECDVAYSIEGAACDVTAIGSIVGNPAECGFRVLGGSNLNCNMQFARTTSGGYDIDHQSTGITNVWGIRTESRRLINCTNGTVNAFSVQHEPAAGFPSITVASPGIVRASSCIFGTPTVPGGGGISGNGDVYLRGVIFGSAIAGDPILLLSFTGRVCEFVSGTIFTQAKLPPAAEGLLLNLSDSNVNGWGNVIGPTTGSFHVLARKSGSVWTVVGK